MASGANLSAPTEGGVGAAAVTPLSLTTVALVSLLPGDGDVSPVTLSSDWSRVARILLLASLAVLGSVGNVFMISAVMIEDYLKKRGNAFVVNVALADLLITGLVIPASAVIILAGMEGSLTVCKFQWFLAVLCFLVTVLTIASTAAENYARLCSSGDCYEVLTPARITGVIIAFWCVCSVTSGLQFVFDISFDYCSRKTRGLLPYQATIGVIFVALPITFTFYCYARIACRIRAAKSQPSFKPPAAFNWDYQLMKTNFYSCVLFLLFWLPFGITLAVGSTRSVPNKLFYHLAWFALSKSCVNNFIYCITNEHFRGAYVILFHYCCCKSTVSFSRRQRGVDGVTRPSGDVRVHIIPGYNMYSYTSPQRAREGSVAKRCAGGSSRPTSSLRPNGRDVYEL